MQNGQTPLNVAEKNRAYAVIDYLTSVDEVRKYTHAVNYAYAH